MLLQPLATSKFLHASDINTVNASAIIGQQRSQRTTNNLRPVHNANSVTEQTIASGKNSVVDVEVLEDLNGGQRGARQDALLALGLGVQVADVLVHVEDVAVAQTLDILGDINNLLQVLILAVVEDWVVDDDAVDFVVGVGGEDGAFNIVAGNFAEGVLEAAIEEPVSPCTIWGSSWLSTQFRFQRFQRRASMNHTGNPTKPRARRFNPRNQDKIKTLTFPRRSSASTAHTSKPQGHC